MNATRAMLVGLVGGLLASGVRAHDEGHGPKLTDSPQQGGIVTAMVEAKDAGLGTQATLVYKAELVRLKDGAVRVYLYDAGMKPLPLAGFSSKGSAALLVAARGKTSKKTFALTLDAEDGAFVGTMPKPSRKPYNLDVTVTEGKRRLLAAFDNLD